jgi:hypothetical protein
MARADLLDTYRRNSPYFRQLVSHYGDTLPLHAANSVAANHGTTLDALGFEAGASGIDTLSMAMELGY